MSGRVKEKSYAFRGAIALIAGCFGCMLLWVAIDLPRKAGEAWEQSQRVISLPDAHSAATGSTAVVDGTIANETPLLRGDFVAYRRQQTQGAHRTGTKTVTIGSRKQPLAIDTSRGRVQIVNNDYRFEDRHLEWAGAKVLDPPASFTEGAIATLGFQRAGPVVAVGVVTGTGDELSVKADFIVAGPRAAYLQKLDDAAESRVGTVLACTLIGALLLLYAIWECRRIYRD